MIRQNIFQRVRTPKKTCYRLLLLSLLYFTIITIIIINSVLVQWIYSRFGANQFPFSENEKEMLRRP